MSQHNINVLEGRVSIARGSMRMKLEGSPSYWAMQKTCANRVKDWRAAGGRLRLVK